jgi:hypothetical protein
MIAIESARSLSGIDLVRRIMHGEIPPPPIFDLLDFHPTEVEPGKVSGEFQPFEFHDYPMGGAHGGVISTLLDSATVRGKHFPQEKIWRAPSPHSRSYLCAPTDAPFICSAG